MTDTETTTIPCPDWCTLPAGHEFHSMTDEGLLVRTHEQLDVGGVGVYLIAEETAASDEDPVLSTEHRIEIDLAPVRRVTGAVAIRLAAALLNVAALYAEVTEATS